MEAQVATASFSPRAWSPAPNASPIVRSVHAMLHPRNIVLVGATDKPGN
jgi:acetate---CoA ligase (ADP-forming)